MDKIREDAAATGICHPRAGRLLLVKLHTYFSFKMGWKWWGQLPASLATNLDQMSRVVPFLSLISKIRYRMEPRLHNQNFLAQWVRDVSPRARVRRRIFWSSWTRRLGGVLKDKTCQIQLLHLLKDSRVYNCLSKDKREIWPEMNSLLMRNQMEFHYQTKSY